MGPKDRVDSVSDEGVVAELTGRLERARERLGAARENHAQLSRVLEGADAIVSAYSEERARAREAEAALAMERDEIDAELAPLVEELQRRNEGRAGELAPLQRELASASDSLASLEARRAGVVARAGDARTALDRALFSPEGGDSSGAGVDSLRETMARLEEELHAIDDEIATARARRDALRERVSEVESRHLSDSVGVSSRVEALQRRRIQCDKDLGQRRETMARCAKRIADAESVRDHPDFVEGERRRVVELEAEVARLTGELAAAQEGVRRRQVEARRARARRVVALSAVAVVALVAVALVAGRALWVGDRVVIDDAAFPDPAISYVAREADTDGDGMLSREEIGACTSVVAPMTVSDLSGLSVFSDMESLSLRSCDAGDICLSGFPGLRRVEVGLVSGASLDVSGLDGLERLTLKSGGGFARVDLSGCSSLTDLYVYAPVGEFVVDAGTNRALVRELRWECEQNGWILSGP